MARADDLDQVLVEATDSIEREVAGLKQLVDEFSRFARMPEVTTEAVEFAQVVEGVLALYKGVSGVEWDVDLDPRVGSVRVDARQMRRALINLIDNAVGAVNGKGTIRVATRPAGVPGSLRLEVADSGPGIPAEDRDKMFTPYFSTKKRGTGLGLAIVHKVVTDHRGTIRVEDNRPRGARFVIEIPA
jgi:two-component system nitrogen regulation sensor histidine kinase NtrY